MKASLISQSLTAIALVMLVGCQSSPSAESKTTPIKPLPTDRNATMDDAVSTDPCALRLGDITATLTMYYGLNKQLPASLDELKALAAPGTDMQLTCPVSSQPYVYSPAGLLAVGTNKKIIVWDATPAHDGSRWCILMSPPQPGGAVSLELVALPEAAFKLYVPAIQ